MKYMGSKNKHAKELLPIILKDRQPGQWYVEPFCGGCNMIDKVDGNRIANDSHFYLIELLKYVSEGGDLPDFITEKEYSQVRLILKETGVRSIKRIPDWKIGFIGFCCSFGGKWMGGYARSIKKDSPNAELLNRPTRNYCAESKRNLLKQAPNLKGIVFLNKSYDDLGLKKPCIIYCDPPYEGTTKYKDSFDHVKFWDWCRQMVNEGHKVFISEYNAPDDFICVWSKETKANFSLQNDIDKNRTEKLFIHKSQL